MLSRMNALLSVLLLATPILPPPAQAGIQKLMRLPHVHEHLKVYFVDESCLPPDEPGLAGAPHGVALEKTGAEAMPYLTLGGTDPAAFPDFKTWAACFAKGKHRLVYGTNESDGVFNGYLAQCVSTPPVLTPSQFTHMTDKKHPELERQSYRISFQGPNLAKLLKAPANTLRLAIVYDPDILIAVIPMASVRNAAGDPAAFDIVQFE
jgi:hypothetical protein